MVKVTFTTVSRATELVERILQEVDELKPRCQTALCQKFGVRKVSFNRS